MPILFDAFWVVRFDYVHCVWLLGQLYRELPKALTNRSCSANLEVLARTQHVDEAFDLGFSRATLVIRNAVSEKTENFLELLLVFTILGDLGEQCISASPSAKGHLRWKRRILIAFEYEISLRRNLVHLQSQQRRLIRRMVELGVIGDDLMLRLLGRGVSTAKGNSRAQVAVFLAIVDREEKIARALGLARKSRPVTFEQFIGKGSRVS